MIYGIINAEPPSQPADVCHRDELAHHLSSMGTETFTLHSQYLSDP